MRKLALMLGLILFLGTAGTAVARTHHHLARHGATAGNDPVLFGDTALGNMADNNTAGLAQAFKYTASVTGAATDAQVFDRSGSTATTILVGVYSTTNGRPGALIASGSLSSPTAGAWNDVPLSSASITAGQSYWIALLPEGGTLNYFDTRGGGTSYVEANRSLTALPSTYVTAHEWNVSPASAYVNGTTTPPPPPPPPVGPTNTAAPTIGGTAQQGDTLTVSNGTWTGDTPMSFTYLWSDGTTGSSDTLSAADVGQNITATVTATNDGGNASATSAPVGPVAGPPPPPPPVAPSNAALPTISGSPQVGNTLVASNGTWTGDTPITFTDQWSDGTTGATDTLTSADLGQQISVTVTASNDGGSASATSAQTAAVTQPSSLSRIYEFSAVFSLHKHIT